MTAGVEADRRGVSSRPPSLGDPVGRGSDKGSELDLAGVAGNDNNGRASPVHHEGTL